MQLQYQIVQVSTTIAVSVIKTVDWWVFLQQCCHQRSNSLTLAQWAQLMKGVRVLCWVLAGEMLWSCNYGSWTDALSRLSVGATGYYCSQRAGGPDTYHRGEGLTPLALRLSRHIAHLSTKVFPSSPALLINRPALRGDDFCILQTSPQQSTRGEVMLIYRAWVTGKGKHVLTRFVSCCPL